LFQLDLDWKKRGGNIVTPTIQGKGICPGVCA
jgi:hypothetical protein